MGFVVGCLKTMNYHPTITLISDPLAEQDLTVSLGGTKTETVFYVEMWKEKEED